MSTRLDKNFNTNDIIEADHVKQFADPINRIESGEAFFDQATNVANAYKVDFSDPAENGIAQASGYSDGLMIRFRAVAANTGAATLTVTGYDGSDLPADLSPKSITKNGGDALVADDIKANQIIAVVFNAAQDRFELLGGPSSSSSPVGGLADLSDVQFPTSLMEGEILQYDSGDSRFENRSLSSAGIAAASHTHSAADIDSGTLPVARGGTGAGDAAGARSNLSAQAQNASLDDISGLTLAKGDILVHDGSNILNLGVGMDGQVLRANSTAGTGVDWADPAALSDLDDLGDVAVNMPADGHILQYDDLGSEFVNRSLSDAGIAAENHTHDATDIDSGTLPLTHGGTGASDASGARSNLSAQAQNASLDDISSLTLAKGDIMVHDGTNVKQLGVGFDGHMLSADSTEATGVKWIEPVTDLDDLSDVSVSSPADGDVLQFDNATSEFVNRSLSVAGIAAENHTHDASDIDSGTLPLAYGGTGASDAAGARSNLSAQAQDASLDEISALALAKGDIMVHDGSNILKLGVGMDGQVLRADSTAGTGVEWADPSAELFRCETVKTNPNAVDGAHYHNVLTYHINGTPTKGLLIQTNIPFTTGTAMPLLKIEGFMYGEAAALGLLIHWYCYGIPTVDFVNEGVTSFGSKAPDVYLFDDSGTVSIFIDDQTYYQRLVVSVQEIGWSGHQESWFTGWTASDDDAGANPTTQLNYSSDFGDGLTWKDQKLHVGVAGSGSAELSCSGAGSTEHFGRNTSPGSYTNGVAVGFGATLGGNYSVALGQGADADGGSAVAVGQQALANDNSITIGYQAEALSSGTALGRSAKSGSSSVSVGYFANNAGQAGSGVFIGYFAGQNATGNFNTCLGHYAGQDVTSAVDNVFLGKDAGRRQTGSGNVFTGYQCGFGISSSSTGTYNVGMGHSSLYSLTTGYGNVGIGREALYSLSTSNGSVAMGTTAGKYQTGNYNTWIGHLSGVGTNGSSSGIENVAIGLSSGRNVTTGEKNVFIGPYTAGDSATAVTGSYNVVVGARAGRFLGSGANNTIVGRQAGYNQISGTGSVFLGYQAGFNETGSNKLYVSNSGTSNPLIHGEFDNKNLGINTSNYGGGKGVIAIANRTQSPGPITGGGVLYVQNGALCYVGSSGSVSVIAVA